MKKAAWILTLFLCISAYSQHPQRGFLHAEGKKIVDGNNENVLLKGIGLGGYMLQEGYMLKIPFKEQQQHVIKEHISKLIGTDKTEEFYKAWRKNFIQKRDVDSLKSWGFNSIRLPMHYNLFTLSVEDEPVKGENTWKQEGFAMVDSLVSWCKADHIYLILDMHATPGGQGHDLNISDRDPSKPSLWESKENQQKLIALWTKLAERYKDETSVGAYDIINEPNWTFEGKDKNGREDSLNKPLRELMVSITTAIRKVDQNHIIIIEGNGWGNNYKGIFPPWDANMVVSFHKYWNYNTQKSIQQFLDYRDKYNLPIWLGESGENSNAWFTDAISLMEKNNIGWCWWPLKKLGSNNPVQIKVNPGYQEEVLNYWKGDAEKPSEQGAYKAFMQLAENTRLENCIIHYDVIDAMMRQPGTINSKAYKKINIPETSTINAVDYDLGNNGVAYKDSISANYWVSENGKHQSWNNGGAYRNDGVDIYLKNDQVYVGDTQQGEWLQYTFNVEKEGDYQLFFNVSSEKEGKAAIEINKKTGGDIEIPITEAEWKQVKLSPVHLNGGVNHLIFRIKNGGFKFKSIRFQKND